MASAHTHVRLLGATVLSAAIFVIAGASDLHAAAPAEATRYYLMSFRDQPVEEVARTVLGETLTHPYRIDPAVEGEMDLAIDGSMDEAGLLRAFALAAGEAGVAVDEADGMLILRPMTGPAAAPRIEPQAGRPRPVYGRPSERTGRGGDLSIFAAGVASGVACLAAIFAFLGWRRRRLQALSISAAPLALEPPTTIDPLDALPPMPERQDAYSR